MKKIITLSLSAALITSAVSALPASAETAITNPSETSIPMKLAEVKDGQFNEKGEAYFTLTIEQEGYYRLAGDKTRTYETAITTDQAQLENAEFQAASKLRMLKKGTYYVKVKGLPNTTYHFKFAERIFDMDKEWPANTDTVSDGHDTKNVSYFPFYANRQVSATLKLTEDKHIRFYSGGRKDNIKALVLKNVATGKTYTAKKISNYTFSSNAPNGTYKVSLSMTDEFIENPFIGKARMSYTLGEHLPLNTTTSTDNTPFNTLTLNLKKDTKIQFTLFKSKKDRYGQRFSIYDDQHNLVKRVHLQKNQHSRTFTYTLRKGRYSIVASDINIRTFVKNETNVNTKFTIKNNTLVELSTGKLVKGYQVYQKNLYKDGKLTTGRVKYGKFPNMKLYKDGILQRGVYITKNRKYFFKNGVLAQGIQSFYNIGTATIYKNGLLINDLHIEKDDKLYDGNTLKKGKFVMLDYLFDYEFLSLYIDGHLAKGLHKGTYGKNGETYLFEDGKLATAFYNGKAYLDGKVYDKPINIKDTFYINHKPYTGVYPFSSDETSDSEMYDNGKFLYYVTLKTYLDQLEIIQQLQEDATNWNEEVPKLVDILTKNIKKIEDGYGRKLISENPPELSYDDFYPYDEYAQKQLLEDLQNIKTRLQGVPNAHHAQAAIEKGIKSVYTLQNLHYENGALLDGEYEGNYYKEGKLIDSAINHELSIAEENYRRATYAYKDEIEKAEDKESLTNELLEKLLTQVVATHAIATEHKNPVYPNAEASIREAQMTLENSVDEYRFIEDMIKTYHLSIDLMPLQQKMKEAGKALELNVALEDIDTQAAYQTLSLNKAFSGEFDEHGFAYFQMNLQDEEGVYKLNTNYAIANEKTNVWISKNVQTLPTLPALKSKDKENLYLTQGTHYIVVRGKPKQSYEFELAQYDFNYNKQAVWQVNDQQTTPIDLPYFKKKQVRIPIEITNNENISFNVYDARRSRDFKNITEMMLTNDATGKVYVVKEKNNYGRFFIELPKGKYTLTYTPPENVYGKGGVLNWVTYTPISLFNSKDVTTTNNVIVMEKDTKFTFDLMHMQNGYSAYFYLYDEHFNLIKKVTSDNMNSMRNFTYTIKKGKYYLRLSSFKMSATAK